MDIVQDNNLAPTEGTGQPKIIVSADSKPRRGRPPKTKKLDPISVNLIPKVVPDDETFEIYNLLRRGYNESEIKTMYKEIPQSKFKRLLIRARGIQRQAIKDYERMNADVLDKLWYNYQLAQQIGDIKDSTIILQTIAKVTGLTKDVNVEGNQVITVFGNVEGGGGSR